MPVCTGGAIRVSATLRASTPRIAARPSGKRMSGDSPAAIARSRESIASLSAGSSPTEAAATGEAATASAPSP